MLGTQRQGNKAIHMLRLLDMEKASGSTEATAGRTLLCRLKNSESMIV